MTYAGFAMLAAVAAIMLTTGQPAFVAMIGVASIFGAIGTITGAIPFGLLTALPSRLIGLLETDLLQALPLYVLMGVLLNTLPLAGMIFAAFARLAGPTAAAPLLASVGLGALLSPMNGSVGSSVAMLSRVMAGPLAHRGVPPSRTLAITCASSVLGVVVPPSLVLILLGDAMMRAHTEALNTSRQVARVINTQDLFHGALLPAGLLFVLFLAMAWWRGRGATPVAAEPVPWPSWLAAGATTVFIVGLLAGVAVGRLYAVEAAATGAFVLTCGGLASGRLRGAALRTLLEDTMAITGALFGLFVAATTFTLVFRAFGTDQVLADAVVALPGGAYGSTAAVLGMIALSALVLDAFEIILVVVPLVMPPLLVRSPDATWNGVLVLLVLQASFLLPPFGYAVMLARGMMTRPPPIRAIIGAVAPFLAVQIIVLAAVLAAPALVRPMGQPPADARPPLSDADARALLMQVPPPPDPDE